MSDIKDILEKTESKGSDAIEFISKHRTVILILVASVAIIISVLQAQSYLNPPRDENKYNEIKATITTKEIDQETVIKLQKTQDDVENTADSNFVEDRTNPFAE
jgi:hypothetical protein